MKNKTSNQKESPRKLFVTRNAAEPFLEIGNQTLSNREYWRWGDDNQFPYALAIISRKSTTHRRIITDKADYISGKGFSSDTEIPYLKTIIDTANGSGETLRRVMNKLAYDKTLFGNAFLEIVTDANSSFLSLFHQDASRCRIAKQSDHVIMHHDWSVYKSSEAKKLPIYPIFEKQRDGTIRSMLRYMDYEPMFENYGVPAYIAGLNVSAIAYKTDMWNISRLDNSFQPSGVMLLDAGVESEEQAAELIKIAEKKFAGKPGQVMFMVKECDGKDGSQFIPLSSSNEGDWAQLHNQAMSDIVVAHSWFRSLSGLDYSSGFNSERILHEYEIALNTLILAEQEELMEPIRTVIQQVLKVDASSMQIVNRPPARIRPAYMKVWEARKSEGLDYDQQDASQNIYLAQIGN